MAVAAGAWLPWVSFALLALGVVVTRRRPVALIGASAALAIAMSAILAGIGIGRIVFVASVSPSLIPAGVATTVYATVTTRMQDTAVAVLVLALVGWYSGPFAVPRRLRGFFGSGAAWVRAAAERHGISTGTAGERFYAQRVLLRSAVAVVAAAIVLFVRPLSSGLIVGTLVVAAAIVAILEVVQRPVITVPENASEDTPVMTVS
ncbi:hypothetical protein [Leifsonia xyli]|uniref:hypothetical protein n=1 Tax=Leifsonia xyli TaxID=1575 RepID=UPI00042182E4|nr:hypothetical protein [Leifsonia xyli]